MQVECSHLPHLQEPNLIDEMPNITHREDPNLTIQTGRQANNSEKPQFLHRASLMKTQNCETTSKLPKSSMHKSWKKSQVRKFLPNTHRSDLLQSTHFSNQLILVYLMYKEQKLSLFLNKGISFETMIRKMYKEIYIYQKQSYSISNAILKNLLYKITGFESIDNDILYDFQLKYKRGALIEQKFFVPFMQVDHKMPFKIYTRIGQNSYGGDQFLARNYSDGQWIIINTIRKNTFDEEKINFIKKSLKINSQGCSLLLKNCSSSFNQINWLQTKHYLIISSEYSIQTFQQNLIRNYSAYDSQKCQQIFVFYAQWFAHVFKQITLANIQNFKKISLQNIGLSPSDGKPKISIFDNAVNCIDFSQKRKSFPAYGKRTSQKMQDIFYYESYLNLMKSLHTHLKRAQTDHFFVDFFSFLENDSTTHNFNFDKVFSYFSNASFSSFAKEKEKNPLKIDFTSNLKKIVSNMQTKKLNSTLSDQETLIISELKQEIKKLFCMENMRISQQRNEAKSIIQMLGANSNLEDIKKQNFGNLSDFKKEEERKYNLKKKERQQVQEIMNELSQNEKFIKTTKENNLASIEFYLKKSDEKIKKKIVQKIETKYKKFLERKVTNFQDDALHKIGDRVATNQDFRIQDLDFEIHEESQRKYLMLPNSTIKSRKDLLAESHTTKYQNHIQVVSSLLDKENIASQILSRLQQKTNSYMKTAGSSNVKKKASHLEQLFINKKNYTREEKTALKKKQYGVYLEEADKQFNIIKKLYRKPKTITSPK